MTDRAMTPLPCVICGRELETAMEGERNQPYAGTTFNTHGHYGSTVFDPMMVREYLEINLCDPCLVSKAKTGVVLLRLEAVTAPVEDSYELWKGPRE